MRQNSGAIAAIFARRTFSHGLDPKRPIVNVRFRQSGLQWRFAFCLLARSIHPERNVKTTNTMNDGRDYGPAVTHVKKTFSETGVIAGCPWLLSLCNCATLPLLAQKSLASSIALWICPARVDKPVKLVVE